MTVLSLFWVCSGFVFQPGRIFHANLHRHCRHTCRQRGKHAALNPRTIQVCVFTVHFLTLLWCVMIAAVSFKGVQFGTRRIALIQVCIGRLLHSYMGSQWEPGETSSTKESTEPTTESTTTTAAESSTSSTVEATAPTTESTTVAESTTESTTASTTASTAASTSQEPSSVSQTTATQSSTEAWCNGETHRYRLVYHCWLNKVQANSRNCLAVTFIAGDWISCFVAWVCAQGKLNDKRGNIHHYFAKGHMGQIWGGC